MRLVEFIDGALELRWTWLPYWLATNGKLKTELDAELKSFVLTNRLTTDPEDLDTLNEFVCQAIQRRFPAFQGLDAVLRGIGSIQTQQGAA